MSELNTSGNWHTQTPGCTPQTDPPAPDLGAHILAELRALAAMKQGLSPVRPYMLRALLTAYDAQATRLAALAALEQAARAWRADDTVEAESIFWDAVADLDAPPGKGA